jgi:hypothetical protein
METAVEESVQVDKGVVKSLWLKDMKLEVIV